MTMKEAKAMAVRAIEILIRAQDGPSVERRQKKNAASELLNAIPVEMLGRLPDELCEELTRLV